MRLFFNLFSLTEKVYLNQNISLFSLSYNLPKPNIDGWALCNFIVENKNEKKAFPTD